MTDNFYVRPVAGEVRLILDDYTITRPLFTVFPDRETRGGLAEGDGGQ